MVVVRGAIACFLPLFFVLGKPARNGMEKKLIGAIRFRKVRCAHGCATDARLWGIQALVLTSYKSGRSGCARIKNSLVARANQKPPLYCDIGWAAFLLMSAARCALAQWQKSCRKNYFSMIWYSTYRWASDQRSQGFVASALAPMSRRYCTSSKVMSGAAWYARSSASRSVLPIADTPSTRPPEVRN